VADGTNDDRLVDEHGTGAGSGSESETAPRLPRSEAPPPDPGSTSSTAAGRPASPGDAEHDPRGEDDHGVPLAGSDQLFDAIRGSRMLGHLRTDELPRVLSVSDIVRADPGERLLRRSDDAVLLMLSGSAKEHAPNLEGHDVVLRVLGMGDVAGLTGVLAAEGRAHVTALEPAQALVIGGSDLRALAGSTMDMARGWTDATTRQLAQLRQQLIIFAATSTAERVIHRLVELTERWGEPVPEGIHVRAHLTQEELASWAGASRESTARVLQSLRRAGIVSTSRRTLVVRDPERLRRRASTTLDLTVTELLPTVR
jgi:CRP/FNR family transcriptional regulator, cyclic AMP receptor protein